MGFWRSERAVEVAQHKDEELEDEDLLQTHEVCRRCRGRDVDSIRFIPLGLKLVTVANIVLFVVSTVFLSIAKGSPNGILEHVDVNDSLKKVSTYSPILNMFEFNLTETTVNGRVKDDTSIWRKPPCREVDEAWNHISMENAELIAVTKSDVQQSGKNATLAIEIPPDWNQGSGKYLAQVEVFHNIHCLDELRKEVWSEHYYKGREFDEVRRVHKAHCIHMLLQTLTCSADVGIITHNWIKNDLWPGDDKIRLGPDFSIKKQCRNFDSLLDWMYTRAIKNTTVLAQNLKWHEGMAFLEEDGYNPPLHSASHVTVEDTSK